MEAHKHIYKRSIHEPYPAKRKCVICGELEKTNMETKHTKTFEWTLQESIEDMKLYLQDSIYQNYDAGLSIASIESIIHHLESISKTAKERDELKERCKQLDELISPILEWGQSKQ